MQDRRILIPISAAVILTVVCVVRVATNRPQNYADQVAVAIFQRPAPPFEVLDSQNHLVRLASFLGRHKIIVVFFDGSTEDTQRADPKEERTPEQEQRLKQKFADLIRLRDRYEDLRKANVKVIAVSAVIPQVNRASATDLGEFPFPMVSDFDPTSPEGALRIHRQWGRFDLKAEKPLTGIFLIDRKGQMTYNTSGPMPLDNIDQAIDEALK